MSQELDWPGELVKKARAWAKNPAGIRVLLHTRRKTGQCVHVGLALNEITYSTDEELRALIVERHAQSPASE